MLNQSDMDIIHAFEAAFGIPKYQLGCQIYSGDVLEIKVTFEKVPDAKGVLADVKTEGLIGYKQGLEKVLAEKLTPTPSAA